MDKLLVSQNLYSCVTEIYLRKIFFYKRKREKFNCPLSIAFFINIIKLYNYNEHLNTFDILFKCLQLIK